MQSLLNLGADVDSRFIVIACAGHSFAPQKTPNERKPIAQWLRQLPQGTRLGMESTGSYHELLADMAHEAGLQVFVINPRQLRRYAESVGNRGKTDRMDALVIARYVEREHSDLHDYVRPSKEQRTLAGLMNRRATLVKAKDSAAQSLRGLASLARERRKLVACIDCTIAKIELQIQRLLEQLPTVAHAAARIETIPGFGKLTSTYLAYRFTRLPYTSGDAAVAQTGLDPRPDDSGKRSGRRKLSKAGPSEQRRLLFNCGRTAARLAVWRPYYEAQLAKGLSKTAAAVVLARKMVRVAFALYTHDRPFAACYLTQA